MYMLCDIIIGLILVTLTSSSCPDECTCIKTAINCRDRGLNDSSLNDVIKAFPVDTLIDVDVGMNDISWTVVLSQSHRVRHLLLDFCQITRLRTHSFRYLHFTELIDLSHNAIELIETQVFTSLPLLRHLKLSWNRLVVVPEYMLQGLTLTSLSLDHNNINHITDEAFHGADIDTLNMSSNNMNSVTYETMSPLVSSLTTLSISHNKQSLVISTDALQGFTLTSLDLTSSGLTSLSFLENVASVETLLLGDNPLGNIELSWSTGVSLSCQYASLNDIHLTTITAELLSSLRSIITLNLSGNQIRSVNSVVFKFVPDIRQLDLSRNLLSTLPDDIGNYLEHLETLNASRNTLTHLPRALVSAMHQLKILDISDNQLLTIPDSFKSLHFLDITNNRLHCNCQLRWLRDWMMSSHGRQVVQHRVWCNSPSPAGFLEDRLIDDFVCTQPAIVSITSHMNVPEGSDVILSCTGDSDPAPSVTWSSPTNEVMTISPSDDSIQRRLSAIWQLRRVHSIHNGWYMCTAHNIFGNITAFTYLHIVTMSGQKVDMRGLIYPDVPLPLTTQIAYITTASNTYRTTRYNNSIKQTTNAVLTSLATTQYDVIIMTSEFYLKQHVDAMHDGRLTSLIVTMSVGTAMITAIIIICIICQRYKRRSGHYPITRSVSVTVRPGWRRCLCCRSSRTESKLNVSNTLTRFEHSSSADNTQQNLL